MKDLINYIVEGKYTEADNELSSVMPDILKVKLFEMKKMVAAKMSVDEMHLNDFSENGADDQKQLPTKSKITKADKIKEQFRAAFSGMGSRQEKLKRDITEEDLEESDLPITTKKEKTATYKHKESGKEIVATKHPGKNWEKLEEETEQLDEAPRVKIVKARIRGGVVQRRKKVSTVPGMTIRGGQLKRMSPIERRNRKLGARKGKIKRKSKMARALIKRARSLRRRSAIGL